MDEQPSRGEPDGEGSTGEGGTGDGGPDSALPEEPGNDTDPKGNDTDQNSGAEPLGHPTEDPVIFGTVARKYALGDANSPRPRPRSRPVPVPPPPKRRSPVKTAGRVMVATLSVAALAATGIGWATIGQLNSANTTDALEEASQAPGAPPENDGATDIMLVGNDARFDSQGNPLPLHVLKALRTEATRGINTDTLIVLRIPHDGGRASAVSIPRDTYVPIAGDEPNKINSAFASGKLAAKDRLRAAGKSGPELERQSDQAGRISLVQTVQDFTGVRIDHYAEVNLLGFYLLTEAVGGVEICLNNAVNDKNSGAVLPAGRQTVSGGAALSFVRQRHGLPGGDLGRIKRQQAFLASAVNKLLSTGTLTDHNKLSELADAVSKSIVLDPGLNVFDLAAQARQLAGGKVEFTTIPITNISARDHRGQSIVTVDKAAVRRFVRDLVANQDGASTRSPAPSTPSGSAPASESSGQGDHFGTARPLRLNALAPVPAAAPEPPTDPIVADGVRCVD